MRPGQVIEHIIELVDQSDDNVAPQIALRLSCGREVALIQRLSQKRGSGRGQALCVTHLAQVAVCATHQLQVRKESGSETAIVNTSLLDTEERVDEIARMLSGTISERSRAHAGELLALANKVS